MPSNAFLRRPSASVSSGWAAKYSVTGVRKTGANSLMRLLKRSSWGSKAAKSATAPATIGAVIFPVMPSALTPFMAGRKAVTNCDSERMTPPSAVSASAIWGKTCSKLAGSSPVNVVTSWSSDSMVSANASDAPPKTCMASAPRRPSVERSSSRVGADAEGGCAPTGPVRGSSAGRIGSSRPCKARRRRWRTSRCLRWI